MEKFSGKNICGAFMTVLTRKILLFCNLILGDLPWNIKRNSNEVTDKLEFVQFRGSNESRKDVKNNCFGGLLDAFFV